MVVSLTEPMRRAIDLARASGVVSDVNPAVGAVVVAADGEVVGQGWHRGSGTAHAEVDALAQAGARAVGATVYCTLEPCAAAGRVGACTHALASAGVARVVFGQRDPNPAMAGGAVWLAEHGIAVEGDMLADECAQLNPTWTFAHAHGRPWVVWKTATTLDGFIAAPDGRSQWITGEPARARVQELRAAAMAVVTGTGTVLADDPRLTVRDAARQPLRVVIGSRALPRHAQVHPAITLDLPVADALGSLWREHGVHRVLVEAGPGLSTALWQQDLVDEVFWFQAPAVMGRGIAVLGEPGQLALAEARRFSQVEVHRVGLDTEYHFLTR